MADFETLNFRGAAACSSCHDTTNSRRGAWSEEGPVTVGQWSASIMAYGSDDPFWQAKVRSEVLRAPHLRETIEGKCAACHTPMAATEATIAGDPVLLFENGFLDPEHPFHDAAMDAISCTICHRIENSENLGTDAGFSGSYTIDPMDTPVNRPHHGPYADTFDQPMLMTVGMANRFGNQINNPAICATCHNLKTPFLDAQGQIVGTGFPEQMPFSEWQAGDLANLEDPIGCQQCHMPIEDEGRIARRPPWLDERALASHAFVSANIETLSLLALETALQGGDPGPLLASVEAGRELLINAGGLDLVGATFDDGTLEFALRIDNLTGHKLPTAFPSRRVYLHAVVRNHRGEIVFESGAMAGDGRIIGVDSDEDPNAFEPHHRTISTPDQVQVYEAVLGNTDNNVTATLLRASQYLKDNRIVPPGFKPTTVPEDIRPAGLCLNDPDFGFGQDEVAYRLAGLDESRYDVSVELRHQAIGYPYLRDLAEFSEDPIVSRFLVLYDAVQPGSELIAALTFEVADEVVD